ncbi:flavohemoglobin expression-modulating QEGLA motif protein [Aliikangiella sp. IMCC44653]
MFQGSSDGWVVRESSRLCNLSDRIVAIGSSLKVLSQLAWPLSIKEDFFANNATQLPSVEYNHFCGSTQLQALDAILKDLGDTPVDDWFGRVIGILKNTARLLESRGSEDFFRYSCELYGHPKLTLKDERSTSLQLAQQYLSTLKPINDMNLGEPPVACFLAETLADEMRTATQEMFAEESPEILIVDELSANALASSDKVRIRRGACFSDNDIKQLIEHEIHIHVATILNGKTAGNLSLLALAHPGATKTQEGLAVFAELITGSLDLDRMRRLADRVVAIQNAIDGADFMDVYRYFLEKTDQPDQSFENARRVFRGGVITGGAPFTKDIVYLDGLLRVHNFMRAAVSSGRADSIQLLFAGRLDIEDLPTLSYLRSLGLCKKPRFLPHWASDLRFLLCYLSYSLFANSVDMSKVSEHYKAMLVNVGVVN